MERTVTADAGRPARTGRARSAAPASAHPSWMWRDCWTRCRDSGKRDRAWSWLPRRRRCPPASTPAVPGTAASALRRLHPWRLLPTPTGTPFTFGYGAVSRRHLAGRRVRRPHPRAPRCTRPPAPTWRTSSRDARPRAARQRPVDRGRDLRRTRSRFLLVLTALERRIGGLRTAGVFLLGHVVATLATEVPVGLAVLVGPSARQLAAPPRLRHQLRRRRRASARWRGSARGRGCAGRARPVRLDAGEDLIAFTDPMTELGPPDRAGDRRRDLAGDTAPAAGRAASPGWHAWVGRPGRRRPRSASSPAPGCQVGLPAPAVASCSLLVSW